MSRNARSQKKSGIAKSTQGFMVVGILAVAVVAALVMNRPADTQRETRTSDLAMAPAVAPTMVPALAQAVPSTAVAAKGRKLLFFMNPTGYPCQTQKAILDGIGGSLAPLAQVVYYKTTEPADIQKFEEFGIRALPLLVIADKDGRELSRFAPGIQSADAVLAALQR